ncbi:acyl-CoA carboxylase subunit epsilon [Streptomyces sp. NPDC056144]|uniref:acyl-CoA carboxylase subunit epsilon n=1 Tax=unclassified Streptomyces TaxID=2593676 RepID=UPI0035DD27F0
MSGPRSTPGSGPGSTPGTVPLTVLRGNPTPEELAGLLVVLAALRGGPGELAPPPGDERRWGRPAGWHRTPPAEAPDAAGWQRTGATNRERTKR